MIRRPSVFPRAFFALARGAGFLSLVALAFFALGMALHGAGVSLHAEGAEEGPTALLSALALCGTVFGVTALMARVERRSPWSYGLADRQGWRRGAAGLSAGVGLFAILICVLVMADAIRFESGHGGMAASLGWAVFWFATYMVVARGEEMLFRGHLLTTLASGAGSFAAIAATSLLFGLAHLSNGLESPIAAVNAVLLGAVLAWSVRRSGSLWWAIGFHGGWDWAESYLAGAADSGVRAAGRLATATPRGAAIWSGGAAGPEGSISMALPIGLAAIACAVALRPAREKRA